MANSYTNFDDRLRRITRRHRRLSQGVVHKMSRDGLITAHPRTRAPRFPLKGVLILIAAAFLFKAFVLSSLGPAVYDARVDLLRSGTVFEQAGAWVMQSDPATLWLAGVMTSLRG